MREFIILLGSMAMMACLGINFLDFSSCFLVSCFVYFTFHIPCSSLWPCLTKMRLNNSIRKIAFQLFRTIFEIVKSF